MFGFSLGELIVVLTIALLVLGPKELIEVVRSCKKLFSQLEGWYKSYSNYFQQAIKEIEEDIEQEEKEIVNYIIDLEGKVQKTYDLSKIIPDLKRNADD